MLDRVITAPPAVMRLKDSHALPNYTQNAIYILLIILLMSHLLYKIYKIR